MKKRHWKAMRRICSIAIIIVTNSSLFLNQTRATVAIDQALNGPPARIAIGAGFWAHTLHGISVATDTLMSLLESCYLPGDAGTIHAPSGSPYPWQAAVPAGPFSFVNTSTGNLFTSVHIVDWESLGRDISFSIFHNSMVTTPDCVPGLPHGWRHSYSRKLYFPGNDKYYFITDEGNHIPLTKTSNSPPTLKSPAGIFFTAVYNSTTTEWKLTYRNQEVDYFDADGRLIRIANASGVQHTLNYSAPLASCNNQRRLLSISEGACGNTLELQYADCDTQDHETCCNDIDRDGCLRWIIAPDIGRDGAMTAREFEITTSHDAVTISRARRSGGAALHTATFYLTNHRIVDVIDFLGTPTHYDYDTDGSAYFMVQNYQTASPLITFYARTLYPHNTKMGPYPVVRTFEIIGHRTIPSQPLTEFCYDSGGRLISIIDPMGRQVVDQVWSSTYLLRTSTNVYGGDTRFLSYDANGNVTLMLEPNGAYWHYTYDAMSNLTSCTDPLGYVTSLQYNDATNPTKPTLIDGPGGSNMTLQWGSNTASDIGKLTQSVSPNGIYQEFVYGDSSTPSAGAGHLRARTFGRMPNGQSSLPIEDGFFLVDCTGNVTGSKKNTDNDVDPIDAYEDEEPLVYKPENQCSIDYDADGNPTSHCNYNCSDGPSGGPGSPDGPGGDQPSQPAHAYNGNNQPTRLQHYTQDFSSVRNEHAMVYDAYGRLALQDLDTQVSDGMGGWHTTNADSDLHKWIEHVYVDPSHEYVKSYDDDNGSYTWTYEYAVPASASEGGSNTPTPIERTVETDLAGRITAIYDPTTYNYTAFYAYNDSTTLPAIQEFKAGSNIITQYYVDESGQVVSIVHKDALGNEALAFQYKRDLRNRIILEKEYHNGVLHATTDYTYGSGHLTAADLDTGNFPEADKLYYNWFAAFPDQLNPSDPNRLVEVVRRGSEPLHHQLRYDSGGNRLALVESIDNNAGTGQPEDFHPFRITRYNYSKRPNVINMGPFYSFDPRHPAASAYGLGDPLPDSATIDSPYGTAMVTETWNDYNELGQDKLLSYRTHTLDPNTDTFVGRGSYAVYEYRKNGGDMGCRFIYDMDTHELKTTAFGYEKNRIESIQTQYTDWTDVPAGQFGIDWTAQDPVTGDYVLGAHGELEVFVYDIFGRRVGIQWCSLPDVFGAYDFDAFGDLNADCKFGVHSFNYIDGNIVERRGSQSYHNDTAYQTVSLYERGASGIMMRTFRNMEFDSQNDPPANEFCRMYMLHDAQGNVRGTMPESGTSVDYQEFDAFGNKIGSGSFMTCNGSESRLAAGRTQWRGAEGSMTDYNGDDIYQGVGTLGYGEWPEDHEQYTRETSGLVFMGARMYEPETGRFTQADVMHFDMNTVLTGQNNRWAYCENDPINMSDPSGQIAFGLVLAIAFGIGMIVGAVLQSQGVDVAGAAGALISALSSLLLGSDMRKVTNACGPPWLLAAGAGIRGYLRAMLMTMGVDMSVIGSFGAASGVTGAAVGAITAAFFLGLGIGGLLYDAFAMHHGDQDPMDASDAEPEFQDPRERGILIPIYA